MLDYMTTFPDLIMTSLWRHEVRSQLYTIFAKVTQLQADFSAWRKRDIQNLRGAMRKIIVWGFWKTPGLLRYLFSFSRYTRRKFSNFRELKFENDQIGGTFSGVPRAYLRLWSSVILDKGLNCALGQVRSWNSKICTCSVSAKLPENREISLKSQKTATLSIRCGSISCRISLKICMVVAYD